MGAFGWFSGGLLLTHVAVRLLTHVVSPPPVLHRPHTGAKNSATRVIIAFINDILQVPFLRLDGCYLSSDEDTVFLEVDGVRWLPGLPLGEGNVGVIRPFEQKLIPLIVQANPEHICRH